LGDQRDYYITLSRGVKRGKARTILMNGTEELLDRLPSRGRLFPNLPDNVANVSSRWGHFFDERREREEATADAEDRPADAWKLRRWRLHDLRHTFAINALLEGADIYDLSRHLGHASVKTTEIYIREIERLPVQQRRVLRRQWKGRLADDHVVPLPLRSGGFVGGGMITSGVVRRAK